MSKTETAILRLFRSYLARPSEMLFLNSSLSKSHPREFSQALTALLQRKYVIKERPRDAYSLTEQGYAASLSV